MIRQEAIEVFYLRNDNVSTSNAGKNGGTRARHQEENEKIKGMPLREVPLLGMFSTSGLGFSVLDGHHDGRRLPKKGSYLYKQGSI